MCATPHQQSSPGTYPQGSIAWLGSPGTARGTPVPFAVPRSPSMEGPLQGAHPGSPRSRRQPSARSRGRARGLVRREREAPADARHGIDGVIDGRRATNPAPRSDRSRARTNPRQPGRARDLLLPRQHGLSGNVHDVASSWALRAPDRSGWTESCQRAQRRQRKHRGFRGFVRNACARHGVPSRPCAVALRVHCRCAGPASPQRTRWRLCREGEVHGGRR